MPFLQSLSSTKRTLAFVGHSKEIKEVKCFSRQFENLSKIDNQKIFRKKFPSNFPSPQCTFSTEPTILSINYCYFSYNIISCVFICFREKKINTNILIFYVYSYYFHLMSLN